MHIERTEQSKMHVIKGIMLAMLWRNVTHLINFSASLAFMTIMSVHLPHPSEFLQSGLVSDNQV